MGKRHFKAQQRAWERPSLVFLRVGAILQMWVTSSYIQIWLWPGLLTNVNLEKNSEIRANYVTAHSVYLLSNNPEMSQLISIFLMLMF